LLNHMYATAPVHKLQEKLPTTPIQNNIDYGLIQNKDTNSEIKLTDDDGYTYDKKSRFINLYVEQINTLQEAGSFFESNEEFCFEGQTDNIFLGLEYRQTNADWVSPVLTADKVYKDTNNTPEVSPIPFPVNEHGLLFTHKETENGIHEYMLYGINWFSRTSEYSNIVSTDETIFQKQNTLLPPSNLHAQLIQNESPLILTTAAEQSLLNANPHDDKTLVRMLCNYTHLHDINYDFADEIELFYRPEAPRLLTGKIKSVEYDENNPKTCVIHTAAYEYLDIYEQKVSYFPSIADEDLNRFTGGIFSVKEKTFSIIDIQQSTVEDEGVIITLQNYESTSLVDTNEKTGETPAIYESARSYINPSNYIQAVFTILENMSNVENWTIDENAPQALSCKIQITDSNWEEHTETIAPLKWQVDNNLPEGGQFIPGSLSDEEVYEETTRGIWDTATIEAYPSGTPEPGVYLVTMNTKMFYEHPQSGDTHPVFWNKGLVRIHTTNNPVGERKVIEVLDIVSQENDTISLLIHDETFDSDPISIGTNVSVNYYPGYKAYLYVDTPVGLTEENILPPEDGRVKHTYLAARTVDNDENYVSQISKATTITAFELVEALPPEIPIGGAYATRPDFYNKSTYTFTVNCQHKPHALAFYRASERMILEALYKPETITQIKAELTALGDDVFFSSRWQNIIDFNYTYDIEGEKYYDATSSNPNGTFRKFPAEDGYRFPKPDKEFDVFGRVLFDGTQEPGSVIEKVKAAIYKVFLPLTEQPLIYSYISSNNDFIPTNAKQNVRDINGNLLESTDERFNQAPMAKIVDTINHSIQFTDFTLDGASKNFYFYYGVELNNRMKFSSPGPISGPIQLINTLAPEAPKITRIKTQIQDLVLEIPTSVKVTVSNYPESQEISKFELYRTTLATDALSIRSMTKVAEIDLISEGLLNETSIEIIDDFSSNNNFIPYGEPLFYKVIALKKVSYTNAALELITDYVTSNPSKTVLANIVDTINPEAPELLFNSDELSGNPASLANGILSWNKAVHNATYYVYKMNDSGNWNLLERIKSNEDEIQYTLSESLLKEDEDEEIIYHRFKVEVENSSGLFSFNDNTITI
ncbi:MAG TPA: hypothetical protein VFD91_03695, partial [Mariniphaga sp.]|nr:hypothetical protein [Mariniphaga sp.]